MRVLRCLSGFCFSKHKCGFKKGYSTPSDTILFFIHAWKREISSWQRKIFWSTFGRFIKGFVVLLANFFLQNYKRVVLVKQHKHWYIVTNRKQKIKVNTGYSSWEEILFRVAQGPIIEFLFFNIFFCDLFFIKKKKSQDT